MIICCLLLWHIFNGLQAWNDASSFPYLLCFVHLVWNCGYPGLQVRKHHHFIPKLIFCTHFSVHCIWQNKKIQVMCDCSDSSEDNQTKMKAKDGTKAEDGSPRAGGAPRQESLSHFHMHREQDASWYMYIYTVCIYIYICIFFYILTVAF